MKERQFKKRKAKYGKKVSIFEKNKKQRLYETCIETKKTINNCKNTCKQN